VAKILGLHWETASPFFAPFGALPSLPTVLFACLHTRYFPVFCGFCFGRSLDCYQSQLHRAWAVLII
jgi:hypothetical protein